MDLDEATTVTKINDIDGGCYLLVSWQTNSYEMYLYNKEKLWKGRFSPNRLAGFSRNLHLSEESYFALVKKCLSQQRDNYRYELKSGFFYWKRKLKDSFVIEGFLPVEQDTAPLYTRPDLIEILLTLNRHLGDKVHNLNYMYKSIKTDYAKNLKDIEEFLKLKIEMEKALCDKFLKLINIKRSKVEALEQIEIVKSNDNETFLH